LDDYLFGVIMTRQGSRPIKLAPGNILSNRRLTVTLKASPEQTELLKYLTAFTSKPQLEDDGPVLTPVYLRESLPLLDGRAVLSIATQRFHREQVQWPRLMLRR
jgi:hypothetical protein